MGVMKYYNCIVSVLSLQSIHVCAAIFCSIEVNYCYIYMYATAITATISVTGGRQVVRHGKPSSSSRHE
jgi:hypothetical protein